MLKIDVLNADGGAPTLGLEGRLVGPWVEELERCWDRACAGGRPASLDLGAMTFADRDGIRLLLRLEARGAVLRGCSPFVAEQLEAWRPLAAPPAPAPAAVEALIDRHATGLYRLALAIVRDRRLAEAIVADALLGLARDPSGAADRLAVQRGVVRAALARAPEDDGRAEARLEAQLPRFDPDGHRLGDDGLVLADWSALTDGALLAAGGRRALLAAIDALPALSRAALALCDVEGCGIEDAAAVLGEAPGTVGTRLHRARMALREGLTRFRSRPAPEEEGANPRR